MAANTTREAMAALVLGELDTLSARIDAIVGKLADIQTAQENQLATASNSLVAAAESLAVNATAASTAEITQRAKEQWAVIGAIASRTATEAAIAAIQKQPVPSSNATAPGVSRWFAPAMLISAGVNFILLAYLFISH